LSPLIVVVPACVCVSVAAPVVGPVPAIVVLIVRHICMAISTTCTPEWAGAINVCCGQILG